MGIICPRPGNASGFLPSWDLDYYILFSNWPNFARPLPGEDLLSHIPRIDPNSSTDNLQRVSLEERFLTLLLPDGVEERIEADELRQLVRQALEGLPPEQLRVIEMRYLQKKSRGRIAAVLELSPEKVAELEKSALEDMRQPLEKWFMDP